MIRLGTEDGLRVLNESGEPVSLDDAGLTMELANCFRGLGFQDGWMAEDLVRQVTHRIRRSDVLLLREQEVYGMLLAMLRGAGFPDVAERMSAIWHLEELEGEGHRMHHWTKEETTQLFLRALPLTLAQAQLLSLQVEQLMQTCGFQEMSESFLLDFAAHLRHNRVWLGATDEQRERPSLNLPVLEREKLSRGARELMNQGILDLPVADGDFPRVVVTIQLPMVLEKEGGWLSEFTVGSVLKPMVSGLTSLLQVRYQELQHAAVKPSPALLLFPGLNGYLRQKMGREEERKSYLGAIRHFLEEAIAEKKLGFPVNICCA